MTSMYLFIIALIAYIVNLLGNDQFLLTGTVVAVVGFILALFSEKGIYKTAGLIGNAVLIFITLVIPFIVTMFFWNQP